MKKLTPDNIRNIINTATGQGFDIAVSDDGTVVILTDTFSKVNNRKMKYLMKERLLQGHINT